MYRKEMDARRGLAVFRMGGASREDWEAHFRDLDEVATWSKRLGFRVAMVVVPSASFSLPDTKSRAGLAARTNQPGYDCYVAIVQPNGVARGLLTMLQWLRGGSGTDHKPFGNEAEARAWLEQKRGELLPELGPMLRATEQAFTEGDSEALH